MRPSREQFRYAARTNMQLVPKEQRRTIWEFIDKLDLLWEGAESDVPDLCNLLMEGFSLKQAQVSKLERALADILEYHFYGYHSEKYRRLLREVRGQSADSADI